MDGFDVSKYSGVWYEHAFHDWTQFGEVYDTALAIELSKDGGRWLDDFSLRGPAPAAAPASWEKSPVANGAHYFLYGKVDGAAPGILQESGFGVTFPNFIVDVKKGARAAVHRAVTERSSRGHHRRRRQVRRGDPVPVPRARRQADLRGDQLPLTIADDVVGRARRDARESDAGGARPVRRLTIAGATCVDSTGSCAAWAHVAPRRAGASGRARAQMHIVPHRPPSDPPIDNDWQRFWTGLGLDKLLTLIETSTHTAFEDTSLGRDTSALKQ